MPPNLLIARFDCSFVPPGVRDGAHIEVERVACDFDEHFGSLAGVSFPRNNMSGTMPNVGNRRSQSEHNPANPAVIPLLSGDSFALLSLGSLVRLQ